MQVRHLNKEEERKTEKGEIQTVVQLWESFDGFH